MVTSLILVETPLQLKKEFPKSHKHICHNPYFSGNSFATEYANIQKQTLRQSQSLF